MIYFLSKRQVIFFYCNTCIAFFISWSQFSIDLLNKPNNIGSYRLQTHKRGAIFCMILAYFKTETLIKCPWGRYIWSKWLKRMYTLFSFDIEETVFSVLIIMHNHLDIIVMFWYNQSSHLRVQGCILKNIDLTIRT